MIEDPFYQVVRVEIGMPEKKCGEVNRILKEAGATLFYDVYGFKRLEAGPKWQSDCYAHVDLYCNGERVDAQDSADRLVLTYPLATIGSEYISRFADIAFELAFAFESDVFLDGKAVNRSALIAGFDALVTKLMEEWGEEPGSEYLRIMIEEDYPRR